MASPAQAPDKSVAQSILDGDLSDEIAWNDGTQCRNPRGIGFWALIAEDYRTHNRQPFSQGFWALFWHRFGNQRMRARPRLLRAPLSLLYRIGAKFTEWAGGIFLPYTVVVGRRVRLEHFGGMILVAKAIGDDVILRQNTTLGIARTTDTTARPVIGDSADIGAGAVIIGDVSVGAGSRIGANAVVTKSVPSGVVAVGVPARIVDRQAQGSRGASALSSASTPG